LPELEPDLVSYRGRDKATAELTQQRELSSKPWFLSLSESWGTPPNSDGTQWPCPVVRPGGPSTMAPPLFKADSATLSFYATKDGKISVSYSSMPIRAGSLTLKMTPSFIRAHGTGLPAALALSGGFQIIRHALAELRAETELASRAASKAAGDRVTHHRCPSAQVC
jgi:hypothetical protein